MRVFEFSDELFIEKSIADVFAFFANAENLNKVTPAKLQFRITSPLPVEMKVDALIEYRLRVHGFPLYWRTRIIEWQPPHHFRDLQEAGPYKLWDHTHRFTEHKGGTLMHDQVRYALPLWPLSAPAHALFIRRDIEQIFAYRHKAFSEIFAQI
jgi:ligand-binding SRPBCC domain-containing protein